MKKRLSTIASAIFIALFFVSCSKESGEAGGGSGTIVPGTPTAMEFSITMPSLPRTYAADPNATLEEITLKKVNVLVYTQAGAIFVLERNAELTADKFERTPGTDTWVLKSGEKIGQVTTGTKRIIVAVNYPGTLPTAVDGSALLSDLPSLVHTLTAGNDLSNTTNGFAMFSTEAKNALLYPESDVANYNANNKVTVTVRRMVAKMTVQEAAGLSVGNEIACQGGILSNLKFAVGHFNKSIYPLQRVVSNVVQDPNWSSYLAADFFNIADYTLASPSYFSVDASSTAVDLLTAVYAPENTAQAYNIDGENLTYISVRAQYEPSGYSDGNGDPKADPDPAAPESFWVVANGDGTVDYFCLEADADAYVLAFGGTKSPEYIDGLTYYRIYPNKNGEANGGFTAAPFDVLRNNYYKSVIRSIRGLGSHVDEGKVAVETSILVETIVEPWNFVDDEYDL